MGQVPPSFGRLGRLTSLCVRQRARSRELSCSSADTHTRTRSQLSDNPSLEGLIPAELVQPGVFVSISGTQVRYPNVQQ